MQRERNTRAERAQISTEETRNSLQEPLREATASPGTISTDPHGVAAGELGRVRSEAIGTGQ